MLENKIEVIDSWVIWSNEHCAFWGPEHIGYFTDIKAAGRYKFEDALKICKGANYPSDNTGYPKKPFPGNGRQPNVIYEVMCPSPEMIKALQVKPDYYYKDIHGGFTTYEAGTDPEVTCWHCNKTFLCDPFDACCRLCHAPFDKSRCDEFNFKPNAGK